MSDTAFPLNEYVLTEETEALVLRCWHRLGRWRSFIIAVDGRDNVGKTVLSRYLSFRLNTPILEADTYLLKDRSYKHRRVLGEILRQRLRRDAPVIVEGIFVAEILESFSLKPDLLIRVSQEGEEGARVWQDRFRTYETRFIADEQFETPVSQSSGI